MSNRIKCKYPMSEFYVYEDEIPPNTRVSSNADCKGCYGFNNDNCDGFKCSNSEFCLITETPDLDRDKEERLEIFETAIGELSASSTVAAHSAITALRKVMEEEGLIK
jgi:hypothetical protein